MYLLNQHIQSLWVCDLFLLKGSPYLESGEELAQFY